MTEEINYRVLVDWSGDGDFGDTGEDITSDVLQVLWTRGRDYASGFVGRSTAGRLSARLRNDSDRYSSFNSGGSLYGNIVPGRRVQVAAGSVGFPYTFPIVFDDTPKWTGFLQRITPLVGQGGAKEALLEAWGPLGYLAQDDVSVVSTSTITTGGAVDDVLDAAGWPAADRNIDAGQTTMDRWSVSHQTAVGALRDIEETEQGFISETRDGQIEFAGRHRRLLSPHTASQATFSDAGSPSLTYSRPVQRDPFDTIYNEVQVRVQTYSVGGLAVLWTLSETGASSPLLMPGESRTFVASYPTPDAASSADSVDAWTTLAENTDYEANSASDGSGTDLSGSLGVTVTKLATDMSITIVNNHASLGAYITLLQARGTPVTKNDPVTVVANDATSEAAYGQRTYESRGTHLSTSAEGQQWADYALSLYRDPVPMVAITVVANKDLAHLHQALMLDISDRVTLVGTGGSGLGFNEDFFIERETHRVYSRLNHTVTWELSPAEGFSQFWILESSRLGSGTPLTVLAY